MFSFFFNLVEKNLLRNFLSVAKMASLVYERENCVDPVADLCLTNQILYRIILFSAVECF